MILKSVFSFGLRIPALRFDIVLMDGPAVLFVKTRQPGLQISEHLLPAFCLPAAAVTVLCLQLFTDAGHAGNL